MDTLFELSRRFIRQLAREERRELATPLAGRCNLLTGSRGVGKSTWTAQYLIRNFPDFETSTECLYIPADHFSLAGRPLYELAELFAQRGGRLLCLDEVHRAEAWARDLKSMADTFPKLEILATGSSLLHLHQGSHDLSRRFLLNHMEGLSFREYLLLKHGVRHEPLSLADILEQHEVCALNIIEKLDAENLPVLARFQAYLRQGYYPYSVEIEDSTAFLRTLQQSALASLESDLPSIHPNLSGASVKRLRRLLAAIAENVPLTPDYSKLRRRLQIADDRTLKDYFSYLEDAELITVLRREGTPLGSMDKPDRIYLGDPNLAHAFADPRQPDTGALRETFFLRSLPQSVDVRAAAKGDFLLNDEITIEVGGHKKTMGQIQGLPKAYLAVDDLKQGSGRRIPLWLFGFLR